LIVTVWAGQLLIALGGLWIVAAPSHPAYGFTLAAAACLGCWQMLRRRLRTA
jgi:hypothetical protein